MFFTLIKQDPALVVTDQTKATPFSDFVKTITDTKTFVETIDKNKTKTTGSSYLQYSSSPIEEYYCSSPQFIDDQIPFWIKQNYGNVDSNENYLISFLKSYYNWLYCGFKKEGTELTPYDIEELFDIDRVPDEFLNYYIKTYAPFINLASVQSSDKQYLRRFLKSIKTDFLTVKGTEESYRHILKSLFNINDVTIDYPKKYLMRLNGGKYINISWDNNPNTIIDLPTDFDPNNPIVNDVLAGNVGYNTETRPVLFGAALNESILPDSNFWNDYSYILTSDANASDTLNYKNIVLSGPHPAGTNGFFEEYIPLVDIDTGSDSGFTGPTTTVELPVIKRYLLFSFSDIAKENLHNRYDFNDTCTPINNYICYCCINTCDPDGSSENFPSHVWPDWDPQVSEDILGGYDGILEIKIGNFLELQRAIPSIPSPNINLIDCATSSQCYDGICGT